MVGDYGILLAESILLAEAAWSYSEENSMKDERQSKRHLCPFHKHSKAHSRCGIALGRVAVSTSKQHNRGHGGKLDFRFLLSYNFFYSLTCSFIFT